MANVIRPAFAMADSASPSSPPHCSHCSSLHTAHCCSFQQLHNNQLPATGIFIRHACFANVLCCFIRALRCARIGHGWFAQETMMAVVTSLAGTRHRRRDSPTPSSITLCKVILPISGVHALSISLLMQEFQFPLHHLLCHALGDV